MTGVGVALIRALEGQQPSPLFEDPLAPAFVAAAARSLEREVAAPSVEGESGRRLANLIEWVRVRTRFLDERMIGACEAGCTQVVILGAGLDARAFRLPWPAGTSLFELDREDVFAFKEPVLEGHEAGPRCRRTVVAIDLRGPWPAALTGAGFDPLVPTAWLAEGLLVYLDREQSERLLADVSGLSASGSRLALTHMSQERVERWRGSAPGDGATHGYVELWRSGLDEHPVAWLARHGWSATAHAPGELAAAYGVDHESTTDSAPGAAWLVEAERS
jgi:methyltransferase (TIGR00027 family)